MKKMFFTVAALVSCLSANAQIEVILGLPLGGAMDRTFIRCNSGSIFDIKDYCSERTPDALEAKNTSLSLNRPYKANFPLPSWVAVTRSVTADINGDGIVSRIAVRFSADREGDVIDTINEKFGPPTKITKVEKQNAYGAKWLVQQAEWETPSIFVSTNCSRIDECAATFMTRAEKKSLLKRAEERKANDKL